MEIGNESYISIINTDNIFSNGSKLRDLVVGSVSSELKLNASFLQWIEKNVTFHNSMVDRMTSSRSDDDNVPRAEPVPSKALVIEDLRNRLPICFKSLANLGVLVCQKEDDLANYISLKLLIANATHTCLVYVMALSGMSGTSSCVSNPVFLDLIDGIFWRDIFPTIELNLQKIAESTYNEWVKRLKHPYFEMSTFFICQNAIQKLSKNNS